MLMKELHDDLPSLDDILTRATRSTEPKSAGNLIMTF